MLSSWFSAACIQDGVARHQLSANASVISNVSSYAVSETDDHTANAAYQQLTEPVSSMYTLTPSQQPAVADTYGHQAAAG